MRIVIFGTALFSALLSAQTGPLTDERIIELTRHGVTQEELKRIILTAPDVAFHLAPSDTDRLQSAGVSQDAIKAMADRENGTVPGAPTNGKRRVFIEDSPNAWSGNWQYQWQTLWWTLYTSGSHPQRVEIMKTFGESCHNYTITNNPAWQITW